jgi:1-acyl-sn-glycerol-3-phosphate acyltransferase
MDSLKIVEELIANNRISFIVAPEGTRSKDGSLGDFKKGAFHIAKNTGVSIVPVIINGAFEAKNKSDWRLTPGIIDIYFADTITNDFYSDISVEELRDYVRGKIKDFVD